MKLDLNEHAVFLFSVLPMHWLNNLACLSMVHISVLIIIKKKFYDSGTYTTNIL
jgi:hypothetical protein